MLDRLLADSARRNRRLRITRTMLGLAATVRDRDLGRRGRTSTTCPAGPPPRPLAPREEAAPAASAAAPTPFLGYGEAGRPGGEDTNSDPAGSGPAEINMAPSDEPSAAPSKAPRATQAPEGPPSPSAAEEAQPQRSRRSPRWPRARHGRGFRGDVNLRLDLAEREGGTEVTATMSGVPVDTKVTLVAVARGGVRTSVASWEVKGGDTFGGSTSLPVADIARFELLAANGTRLITIPVG